MGIAGEYFPGGSDGFDVLNHSGPDPEVQLARIRQTSGQVRPLLEAVTETGVSAKTDQVDPREEGLPDTYEPDSGGAYTSEY
jgi:hypothetical protein